MARNRSRRKLDLIDNRVRGLVILGIILVVFNLLAFSIPFNKETPIFWISYGFTLFAVLAQAGVCFLAFNGTTSLRSKVLGFPIVEIGLIYLLVQAILCLLLMTVSTFVKLPVAVAIVPCVLVLAVAAICIIYVDAGREEIERQDVAIRAKTDYMRMLGADMQALMPWATSEANKVALGRLAEQMRYSDPVHIDGLEGVEAEMGAAFLAVKQQVTAGADASAAINELGLLLNERNAKAKVLKQQAL